PRREPGRDHPGAVQVGRVRGVGVHASDVRAVPDAHEITGRGGAFQASAAAGRPLPPRRADRDEVAHAVERGAARGAAPGTAARLWTTRESRIPPTPKPAPGAR